MLVVLEVNCTLTVVRYVICALAAADGGKAACTKELKIVGVKYFVDMNS